MKYFTKAALIRSTGKYIAFLAALLIFSNSTYAQLPGYSFKKPITIDNNMVSGTADHTDFPFLVSVTDADLKHTGSGGDVVYADICKRWQSGAICRSGAHNEYFGRNL